MKALLILATLLSTLSFADDKVLEKKLILKAKDNTPARIQKEILKFYNEILVSEASVKAERKAIADKLNQENNNESVSDEVSIQSYLTSNTSYEVNGYTGTDLKCETIYSVDESIILFEAQRYKRYESIAFGAQFNVGSTSCIGEDDAKSVDENAKVVVNITYYRLVDLSTKLEAL